MNSRRTTDRKSNNYDDYFLDPLLLMRSLLDAANLINLHWFLYDPVRREAWLAQSANGAASRKSANSGSLPAQKDSKESSKDESEERRAAKWRAADDGQPAPVYAGDLRRRKDRRNRAA